MIFYKSLIKPNDGEPAQAYKHAARQWEKERYPDRRCIHIDGGHKQSDDRADINQGKALPEFNKNIWKIQVLKKGGWYFLGKDIQIKNH